MTYQPRKNFGAKLEPTDTALHGAGQDVNGYKDYASVFDKDTQPAVYMTYIGIAGDASPIEEWGTRV